MIGAKDLAFPRINYDVAATPGLAEAGNEFFSVAGAARAGGDPRRRRAR